MPGEMSRGLHVYPMVCGETTPLRRVFQQGIRIHFHVLLDLRHAESRCHIGAKYLYRSAEEGDLIKGLS